MTRILVVDDSAVDRRLAGGLLTKVAGWQVDHAEDGARAIEILRERLHDVIVTDLQMPNINGLELVQHVRREQPLIPVILMTAQGSESIAVEALKQGAASYVPKSQLTDMLVDIVCQVTSLAGERRTKRTLMSQLDCVHYRFVLGNDAAVLTSLVSHIQGIITEMDILGESERLRVGVALEEALLNAAYHGNLEVSSKLREEDHSTFYDLARERTSQEPFARRKIAVDIRIDREGLEYVICDQGPGFDPGTLPDPTDPDNLDRPCGRGVLLMRTFMDEVHYNPQGNQVTMRKRATRACCNP